MFKHKTKLVDYITISNIFSDLNECILNIDNCDQNAYCNNSLGSFTCTCNDGYTGNGVTCTGANEMIE